jgi:hypothetical protein
LARTNYSFGKRQRELAKKQKREEKLQRRKERKLAGGLAAQETGDGSGAPEAGAEPELAPDPAPADEPPATD